MARYIQDWDWGEAFQKGGFGDGDLWVGTYLVQQFLEQEGYRVDLADGIHNTYIVQVHKDDHFWECDAVGGDHDQPETWLPADLVEKLNSHFHTGYVVEEALR